MKTPYAKYWMTAELLHALGPEDEDAELRAWVRADLDDGLAARRGPATPAGGDIACLPLREVLVPAPPSSNSPA